MSIEPDEFEQERAAIRRMIKLQRIAIVGLSDDPAKPSHLAASYLQRQGKTIIPINPKATEILGEKCYPSLEDVPGPIDLVDVYRRAPLCEEITRSAIKVGVKGVWLQLGIRNDEAKKLAKEAGIDFVQDRCLMVSHRDRSG